MNKKLSIDEIVSSIIEPNDDDATQSDDIIEEENLSPIEGDEDNIDDDDLVEDEDVSDDADEDQLDLDDADADDEIVAETDDLDIRDEDLIEVKVDGQMQTFSIADAKKALSGEGAIDKRVKEATIERDTARKERNDARTGFQQQIGAFYQAVSVLGEKLFEPRIAAPEEALLDTNPTAYHKQVRAHQTELQRVGEMKNNMGQLFQVAHAQQEGQLAEYRKSEGKLLHEKLPVLRDEKLGKQRRKQIIDAAEHYGFSAEEIKTSADHRLFLMAHDAALYRASQGKKKVVQLGKRKLKPPRTLRSVANPAKRKVVAQKKQRDNVVDRARESGKVDDITRMIMKPARKQRR